MIKKNKKVIILLKQWDYLTIVDKLYKNIKNKKYIAKTA